MKIFIYSLFFMIPILSWADTFSEFKNESHKIVQSLLEQGIKKVGKIDLEILDKQIATTNWQSVKDKFLLGSGEERSTSIYLVAQQTVIVNELALQLIDHSVYQQVSLHEALGANGYDDEKSKISLSLDQIAKDPSKKNFFEGKLTELRTDLSSNKIYQDRSGGTSVGGGGDGTAIEFKMILLNIALENQLEGSDSTIDAILESNIEPNWSPQSIHDLRVQKQEKGFRIDIPSVLWTLNKTNNKFKENFVRAVYNEVFKRKP